MRNMFTKILGRNLIAGMILALALLLGACVGVTPFPDEQVQAGPGAPAAGVAMAEGGASEGHLADFADYSMEDFYNPGTNLTETDTNSLAELVEDPAYSGKGSLKISGTLQKDLYSDAVEIGMRIKVASILDLGTIDADNAVFSLQVYVPDGYPNTVVQFVLIDDAYQPAISEAMDSVPGTWTEHQFWLIPTSSPENQMGGVPSLAAVDQTSGLVRTQGAYTSPSFNPSRVTEVEIRSLSGQSGGIGDEGLLYIDAISWNKRN